MPLVLGFWRMCIMMRAYDRIGSEDDMKTDIVFFSPTGTSAATASAIADGMGAEVVMQDITLPDVMAETDGNTAVFVVPVYAGRVPAVCLDRLKNIRGGGASAAVVAVYGNRDYEDALVELRDVVAAAGYRVIAAGAFIGEHSYSTDEKPVAKDRPDAQDKAKAKSFGSSLMSKLNAGDMSEPNIKGNRPYKERVGKRKVTPVTDETKCGACGVCAEACPTAAMTVDGVSASDADKCIICCACVKKCPSDARYINDDGILAIRERLFSLFTARREPEIFM